MFIIKKTYAANLLYVIHAFLQAVCEAEGCAQVYMYKTIFLMMNIRCSKHVENKKN